MKRYIELDTGIIGGGASIYLIDATDDEIQDAINKAVELCDETETTEPLADMFDALDVQFISDSENDKYSDYKIFFGPMETFYIWH